MHRLRSALSIVAAIVGASAAAPTFAEQPAGGARGASVSVSDAEALTIATEAYYYFYPLISMEITRRQLTNIDAGKEPGRGPSTPSVICAPFRPPT
jgi:hypothetical protein